MLCLLSATIFKLYFKTQSQRIKTLRKTNLLMCFTCNAYTLIAMCGIALLSSLCAGLSCLCTKPTEMSSAVGGEAISYCGSPYCSLQNLLYSLGPQPHQSYHFTAAAAGPQSC